MPHLLEFRDPDFDAPVILMGMRPRYRFHEGELHFHHCTECFHDGPCAMACECEFDLSEDGEPLKGAHAECDACRIFPMQPGGTETEGA